MQYITIVDTALYLIYFKPSPSGKGGKSGDASKGGKSGSKSGKADYCVPKHPVCSLTHSPTAASKGGKSGGKSGGRKGKCGKSGGSPETSMSYGCGPYCTCSPGSNSGGKSGGHGSYSYGYESGSKCGKSGGYGSDCESSAPLDGNHCSCSHPTPCPTPDPADCRCEEQPFRFDILSQKCLRLGCDEEVPAKTFDDAEECCDANRGDGSLESGNCKVDDECFTDLLTPSPSSTSADETTRPTPSPTGTVLTYDPTSGSTPTVSTEVTGPPTRAGRGN